MTTNPSDQDPRAGEAGFEKPPRPDAEGQSDDSRTTEGTARMTLNSIKGAVCDIQKQMEDGMLTLLPPTVTRHLVEAHKELVRASQRMGDIALEKLEKKASRAEELHRRD